MGHARKMVLVDPRLLEGLLAQQQQLQQQHPTPRTTVARVMNSLDTDTKSVIDLTDVTEQEKVALYNRPLSRYNAMVDKRKQQPVRLSVVSAPAEEVITSATTTEAPSVLDGLERDVVHTKK